MGRGVITPFFFPRVQHRRGKGKGQKPRFLVVQKTGVPKSRHGLREREGEPPFLTSSKSHEKRDPKKGKG